MSDEIKRIAVTGAAGNIAYSLIFRIAQGELFGQNTKIALHLMEIPEMLPHLQGIKMELEDCAFPLLHEIKIGTDPEKVFEGVNLALLIGAKPRSLGMERRDLLYENAKIFMEQGYALNNVADPDCRVLVVGNPCNTNAWLAKSRAGRLNPANFFAMTRLDQNRAQHLLAEKAEVPLESVKNVIIWGNHSATQVPDYHHATIGGKPLTEVIRDKQWLEEGFIKDVQQRGAEIIKTRGKSSAASAAHAVIDSVQALYRPTPAGHYYSLCLDSTGNPYGVAEDLIFSFPCRTLADGKVEIVKGLSIPKELQQRIEVTESELINERNEVDTFVRM